MDVTATAVDIEDAENALARVIREQGRLKGWVAQAAGMAQVRLSRLMNGEREMTLREAVRLARVLDVPIETFIPEDER